MADEEVERLDDSIEVTPTAWPIDTASLKKGDVITVQQLELAAGRQQGTTSFQMDVLQIKAFVMSALWARGLSAVVVQDRGCLRILTDAEALEYNQRFHDQGLRRARRAHIFQCHVDVAGLSHEQIEELNRSLCVMGATMAAIASARRKPVTVSGGTVREDRPRLEAT